MREVIFEKTNSAKESILAWYESKTLQERRLVALLAGLMLVIIPVFGIVMPLNNAVNNSKAGYEEMLLYKKALMNRASSSTDTGKNSFKGSLLSMVNSSGKQYGIVFSKLDPKNNNSIKANIERGDFNDVMEWLNYLNINMGVSVGSITVDDHEDSGFANFRITLLR